MTRLVLSALALAMTSCVVVTKEPGSGSSSPPPPPPRHAPPPAPVGPDASLQLKYDAALEACYEASRKALGFMKFTEADQGKKTGEITAHSGKIFVRCTMYRRNHHTFLTFYFRVNDTHADARIPGDFAARCHKFVAKEVKEEGRSTD